MSDSSYWAMVAQIIPVMMLALIIEGRFISRQFARKSRFSTSRVVRASVAITFAVASLALAAGFFLSIEGARGNPLTETQSLVAESSLFLGVGVVFISPVVLLTAALVGDMIYAAHRSMPYSSAGRRRRRNRAARELLEELRRDYKGSRLWARTVQSRAYVYAYRAFRESSKSSADEALLDAELSRLASLWERMDARFERIEGKFELGDQRFINGDLLSESDLESLRSALKAAVGG